MERKRAGVSVIIPVFNEEMSIGEVISKIKALCGDYEIIVINDGSTDRTYERAREKGVKVIPYDYWREFAKNPSSPPKVYYWEKELSRDELMELTNMAYKSFYVRPKYIIKQLLATRSLGEAHRKTKAGLKVLMGVGAASELLIYKERDRFFIF